MDAVSTASNNSQEQDIGISGKDSPIENVTPPEKIILVESKHPVLIFLLMLCSFGLYAPFWMVRRVSELKQMSGNKYRPGWWFFVPIIMLAQLFALPKFESGVSELEEKYGLKVPSWGTLWILVIIITTVISNVSEKVEIPMIYLLLSIMINAGAYTLFHTRFAVIKRAIPHVELQPRKLYTKWIDGVLLLLLIPIIVFTLYEFSFKHMMSDKVQSFDKGSTFIGKDINYQINFKRDGWNQVEIGVKSDGTAEYEFLGPYEDMYMMIFSYDASNSLDDAAYWRVDEMQTSSWGSECHHVKYFEDMINTVVSYAECKGRFATMPEVSVSKQLVIDSKVYELYGFFSAAKNTYRKEEAAFIEMVKGFKVAE